MIYTIRAFDEEESGRRQYQGYELNDTIDIWDPDGLSSKQQRCLEMAVFLVEHRCSIRTLARNFGVGKSCAHYWLSYRLQDISYELYCVVKRQLKKNKDRYFK